MSASFRVSLSRTFIIVSMRFGNKVAICELANVFWVIVGISG